MSASSASEDRHPRVLGGLPQQRDVDYYLDERELVFERSLRKDRLSGWRWFLGAWGIGTYRQDDTVDILYEAEGQARVHAALIISTDVPDEETCSSA